MIALKHQTKERRDECPFVPSQLVLSNVLYEAAPTFKECLMGKPIGWVNICACCVVFVLGGADRRQEGKVGLRIGNEGSVCRKSSFYGDLTWVAKVGQVPHTNTLEQPKEDEESGRRWALPSYLERGVRRVGDFYLTEVGALSNNSRIPGICDSGNSSWKFRGHWLCLCWHEFNSHAGASVLRQHLESPIISIEAPSAVVWILNLPKAYTKGSAMRVMRCEAVKMQLTAGA